MSVRKIRNQALVGRDHLVFADDEPFASYDYPGRTSPTDLDALYEHSGKLMLVERKYRVLCTLGQIILMRAFHREGVLPVIVRDMGDGTTKIHEIRSSAMSAYDRDLQYDIETRDTDQALNSILGTAELPTCFTVDAVVESNPNQRMLVYNRTNLPLHSSASMRVRTGALEPQAELIRQDMDWVFKKEQL